MPIPNLRSWIASVWSYAASNIWNLQRIPLVPTSNGFLTTLDSGLALSYDASRDDVADVFLKLGCISIDTEWCFTEASARSSLPSFTTASDLIESLSLFEDGPQPDSFDRLLSDKEREAMLLFIVRAISSLITESHQLERGRRLLCRYPLFELAFPSDQTRFVPLSKSWTLYFHY